MSTTVLNIMSVAFPSITNRLQSSVYLQSDPQALVASQIDAIAGHPARVWSFPGLPRNNYGFSFDEIDGGGAIVRNIAFFDVVPSEIDGFLTRRFEQIQVGVTPGLVTGDNTFTFDGSETSPGSGIFKPDYRGWEILISEYSGVGFLIEAVLDYTWDSTLGLFTLLAPGNVLAIGQWYTVEFVPQENTAGNSYPTVTDFSIILKTATGNILNSEFGKQIIVEPNAEYIELSLPPILTVPQGRKIMVNMSDSNPTVCARFLSVDATINFLRGSIYAHSNESFSIYRFQRSVGVNEWRVSDCDGNFKSVGQMVGDDSIQSNVYNKKLLDGSVESISRYARIYNEIVLNLPLGQAVAFADWGTGNNKYYYSLSNGTQFHFPDRRGVFEMNNNAGQAGFFTEDQVGEFELTLNKGDSYAGGAPTPGRFAPGALPQPDDTMTINPGEDTLVKNYLINKFVLI